MERSVLFRLNILTGGSSSGVHHRACSLGLRRTVFSSGDPGLDGVEHALADLLGVNLQDLNPIFLGRRGAGGGSEGVGLYEAGGGGGLVGGHGAVALGERGGRTEGLDEAVDDGVAGTLGRRPYAEGGIIIIFLTFLTKFKPKHKFTSLPPSPPSLPIIGHLHLLKHPVHRTLHSLSSKLGKILLLKWGSRAVLLVSSPSAAEECYTKHDVAFANRPSLLAGKHFHYNFTTVAAASYGDHWRYLRRVMTLEFFSSSRLAAFAAVRQGEVRLLLNQIMKKSKVELKSKFTELAFNVMTMTVVGKRYFGEDVADDEEAKNFREVMREAVHLSAATNLGDFLPVLQWMDATGLEKKMVRLMKKMDGFLQSLIEERRGILAAGFETNGAELKKLMIDNFLALQQTDPQLYTDEIVKGIILVLLVAGTDTTSTTLEWAMALLLNHPGAMAKLRAEIDTKTGSDHRLLEEQDLPNLNYLQNVITETYRLYPSFPILVPHENSEDCVVGGFDVPHHTMLVINAWAIHRNPEIWEDPEKFKPERFEGWSGEGSEGYKLIPFGAGRRRCPGASLANKLVGLALGSLVQSFEWERIGEEEVDMSEGLGLTMPRVKPLEAICKPRPIMLSSITLPGFPVPLNKALMHLTPLQARIKLIRAKLHIASTKMNDNYTKTVDM
ncbi:hypothetical protein DVH24_020653 [Malus domestica]|uniref:Uncharacterized protein n=1 Tax=Malus domestica TaxID=3750 RepID=A0A498J834_MALDO|nr:hypothetical protein DVH24_020653 [Malus domestica]